MFLVYEGMGVVLNDKVIFVFVVDWVEGCCMLGDKFMFKYFVWEWLWFDMYIEIWNFIVLCMVMVVIGEWDVCLVFNWKLDWDIVVVDLIVREVGGWVIDYYGDSFIYN